MAGKHPFAAGSALDTAFAITHHTPAHPCAERTDFPTELEEVILALLAKEPDSRPSAKEVAGSLQRMEHPAPPAPVQRERLPILRSINSTKWKALAAAMAVVVILIIAAWWRTSKPLPVAAPSSDRIVRAAGLNAPIPPRHVYAIDPQGRLLVYVDNSPDNGGYGNWIAERAATPLIEGVNWASFKQVFAGGDGVIYALSPAGELKYFRLLDIWRNKGRQRWSADSGHTIGTNFDRFEQLAALSPSAWTLPDGRASSV